MSIFDNLAEQLSPDSKVVWTWETPPELLEKARAFPYLDVQDAYAAIQVEHGNLLIWSYVASRQEWARAWSAGPVVAELLDQIRTLRSRLGEACYYCGGGPDTCPSMAGAAPCPAEPHTCSRDTMEPASYTQEMRFGWEPVQCRVCSKREGKPIGEPWREDGLYL